MQILRNLISCFLMAVALVSLSIPHAFADSDPWAARNTPAGFELSDGEFKIEIDVVHGTIRAVRDGDKPFVWANSKALLSARLIESNMYDRITDFIPDGRTLIADYVPYRVDYAIDGPDAFVYIDGALAFPDDDTIDFEVQLTAKAGSQHIRANVRLNPRGSFHDRYIKDVRVHMPLSLNFRKRIAQGGDQGFTWDTRYFYQYHLNTSYRLLTEPERNEWSLFGIDQLSPVAYEIWRAESETTAPLSMQRGVEAPGWSSVYDEEGGVLFAYRDMAAHAPKALRVSAVDHGEAMIMLHPDSTGAFSPYAVLPAGRVFNIDHTIDFLFFGDQYVQNVASNELAGLWDVPSLPSDGPITPREKFMAGHDAWLPMATSEGDLSPWVTGGVALPQGKVNDLSGLQLFRQGHHLDYQSEPLAFWPDGSIKWLLLTFRDDVPPPEEITSEHACGCPIPFQVTFRDGSKREYRLLYADRDESRLPTTADTLVSESPAGVSIDTGPLQIDIVRGKQWIRTITLHGETMVEVDPDHDDAIAFVDFLRVDEPYVVQTAHPSGELDPGPVVIERIDVESAGPYRAVLRLEGRTESIEPATVIIRIEAYKGQTFLRMNHTVEFTHQDPRTVFLRQMGIRLPMLFASDGAHTITIGGEDQSVFLDDWTVAGLRQSSHMDYEIWRRHNGHTEDVEHHHRSAGWIDVSDGRRGVTLAMRNMWQDAPNELMASKDDGSVTAYFWPPTVPLMDVRRYSDFPHRSQGETVSEQNDWVQNNYYGHDPFVGISKTHEVLWFFHEANVDAAQIGAVAADFQSPPLIYMGEQWYHTHGFLASYLDSDMFPNTTRQLSSAIDFWLHHQKLFGWYGKWHYGDIQHRFNRGSSGYGSVLTVNALRRVLDLPVRERPSQTFSRSERGVDYVAQHHWGFDNGRWGWGNTEGLPGLFFQHEYLRTGDRDTYFLAEGMARHVRDVVIRHSGKWFGSGTRHGVQPWSDGHHGERQTVHSEFRFHHYLSGDMRSRDVAQKLLDDHYLVSDISSASHHSGRLYGLLTNWEMTGDAELADTLQRYVRAFVVPEGIAASPTVLFPSVRVTKQEEINTDSMFFHNFGAIDALIEYYDWTHDDALRQALVSMASQLMKTLPSRPSSTNPSWSVIAFAARHADDPKPFETFLKGWFQKDGWEYAYQTVSNNPSHWSGPTALVKLETPVMHFWMNSLVYTMGALDQESEMTSIQKESIDRWDANGQTTPTTSLLWQSEYDLPEFEQYLGPTRPWKEPVRIVLPDALKTNTPLRGHVPIDIDLILNEVDLEDGIFDEVVITLNKEHLYSGRTIPKPGSLMLNTREYENGRYNLSVSTLHPQFGRAVETIQFRMDNWWDLIEEMEPPVTTGFFGPVEQMKVREKSKGWDYADDRPDVLFGDTTRMLRGSDEDEYLIWSTPALQEVDVLLYVQDVSIEKGMELAVSPDGQHWSPLQIDDELIDTSGEGWHAYRVATKEALGTGNDWFRLTLHGNYPAEHIQIGRVTLKGLHLD